MGTGGIYHSGLDDEKTSRRSIEENALRVDLSRVTSHGDLSTPRPCGHVRKAVRITKSNVDINSARCNGLYTSFLPVFLGLA
jgi:hypothetical protein